VGWVWRSGEGALRGVKSPLWFFINSRHPSLCPRWLPKQGPSPKFTGAFAEFLQHRSLSALVCSYCSPPVSVFRVRFYAPALILEAPSPARQSSKAEQTQRLRSAPGRLGILTIHRLRLSPSPLGTG